MSKLKEVTPRYPTVLLKVPKDLARRLRAHDCPRLGQFVIPSRELETRLLVALVGYATDRKFAASPKTPRNATFRIVVDVGMPVPCLPFDESGRRRKRDGKEFLSLAQTTRRLRGTSHTRETLFALWRDTMVVVRPLTPRPARLTVGRPHSLNAPRWIECYAID